MNKEKTAVIAGVALLAAIGGPKAYSALKDYIRRNYEDAKQKAFDYVKKETNYDEVEKSDQLPNLFRKISRGPQWKAVDLAVEELIARQGSKWVSVPLSYWQQQFPHISQIEERPVDEYALPGVSLQRTSSEPRGSWSIARRMGYK